MKKIIVLTALVVFFLAFAYYYQSPTTEKPEQKPVVITYTQKQTYFNSILPGRLPYQVINGTTFVKYYSQIILLQKELSENMTKFSPLAGSNPYSAAKNFYYCPQYNSPEKFATQCGNYLDFFFLYAVKYPVTALLILNTADEYVVYVSNQTVYDIWYTYPLCQYLEYLGHYYSPLVVYAITFYNPTRLAVTTLSFGYENDDGTYIINNTITIVKTKTIILINGTPRSGTYPLQCSSITAVYMGDIIISCRNYPLYTLEVYSTITVYGNPSIGTVVYKQ